MRKCAAVSAVILALTPGAALAGRKMQETQYPKPSRRLAQVVHRVFRGHHEKTAICEAWVESHYDTLRQVRGSSWSPTGDHGYWQINYMAHRRPGETEWSFHRRMSSLIANAREAYAISHHGTDWNAWTTYSRYGLCHGLN